MFKRKKTAKLKESAISASELALQLAQDKKFRKRLLSAIRHSSQARRRVRRGQGTAGTIRRLAADQALRVELQKTRSDLERAYARLDAQRRGRRLRKITLLSAALSLLGVPRIRQRLQGLVTGITWDKQRLQDTAKRLPTSRLRRRPTRPQTLEDLTRDELYARAQEANIPGRSEMSKEQLVAALRARG